MQYDTAAKKYAVIQNTKSPFTMKDIYDVNLLQAMRWAKQSWRSVSRENIVNCWRKTGLTNEPQVTISSDEVDALKKLKSSLIEILPKVPTASIDIDYLIEGDNDKIHEEESERQTPESQDQVEFSGTYTVNEFF